MFAMHFTGYFLLLWPLSNEKLKTGVNGDKHEYCLFQNPEGAISGRFLVSLSRYLLIKHPERPPFDIRAQGITPFLPSGGSRHLL